LPTNPALRIPIAKKAVTSGKDFDLMNVFVSILELEIINGFDLLTPLTSMPSRTNF